jgi:uncharacterized OsmC-like protein
VAATRRYAVDARSTDTFGRVLWSCRDQHFVADGPVQNGCPGEAVTPAELFLAGVASCGVELLQVFAKEDGSPLASATVDVTGELDPETPVRLGFRLTGVDQQEAERLVERFKRR